MRSSLSLDLDNKWSYLQAAGRAEWQEYPSYLSQVIPRIITVLNDHDLKITIFVVGKDVDETSDVVAVKSLVDAGHELANHSFSHQPWLHTLAEQAIVDELAKTDSLLEAIQGKKIDGFRGPGYSDSPFIRQQLIDLGYRYCASPFPSIIGPMARLYYFAKTGLRSKAELNERKELFGRFRDCVAPNVPRLARIDGKPLWIMPVTVLPILRVPIHFSYLMFLAEKSMLLAQIYFAMALNMCRMLRVEPSLLLHPLDFLSKADEPDLGFFPGMQLPSDEKLRRLKGLLTIYRKRFQVCSMSSYVDGLDTRASIRR